MKILIAPDSFKGSLTAIEAADAIAVGVRRVYPEAELILLPLADGGEGTVAALVTAAGGRLLTRPVSGPLRHTRVDAVWGLIGPQEETAVIEMAAAAGLTLLPSDRRNPLHTTTYGVGELTRAAANSAAKRIIIGLGGSATNDGGAGALQAMGVKFFDSSDRLIRREISGSDLVQIARIDTSALASAFERREIVIASDVTNPLLGENGATAVYGPQKGASEAIGAELEAGMVHFADVLKRETGRDVASQPGAGAAGGLGAGLMACLNATMHSGIDLVLDTAGFEEKLLGADFVFTGEGRIDRQTLSGKTISGVLKRCQKVGNVPVVAFAGRVDAEAAALGLSAAIEISEGLPSEEAMHDAGRHLAEAAARFIGTHLNE